MIDQQLKIMQTLKEAYNCGSFKEVIPYLADEIKRTSMWDMSDIEGKENMLAYFQKKEEQFRENSHHISELAVLKYINNQPVGFTRQNVVASKNSKAKNEDIEGMRIVQWYAEGRVVIRIADSYYDPDYVLILVDFNKDNQIKQIDLCNDMLYHYVLLPDYGYMTHAMLHEEVRQEIALKYFKKEYFVNYTKLSINEFPSLICMKDEEIVNVIILVDHYPFYGKASKELQTWLDEQIKNYSGKTILYQVQVKGLGEHAHHIKTSDEFKITIINEETRGDQKHD